MGDSFMEQTISPDVGADVALQRFLEAADARAREKWPDVSLSAEAYAAHLGSIAPDEGDIVAALEQAHCDDLFLACACGRGDPGALRAFEAQIMPRAAAAISRVDPTAQFVEDLCADLRIRFFVASDRPPEIMRYLGRGPLAHWVQVVAMRLASTSKRKKTREVAMDLPDVVNTLLADDPELAPFADQLRRLQPCSPRLLPS